MRESIEEEDEYQSPSHRALAERIPLVASIGCRHPNLREEDITKVNNAFSKLFEPIFKGHRQYLIEKLMPRAGPNHILL